MRVDTNGRLLGQKTINLPRDRPSYESHSIESRSSFRYGGGCGADSE